MRHWPLLAIVAFGLAIRLAGATAWLSHDEGYSWLVATAPDAGAFLERLAATENTPPLFYLLLVPLPLESEFELRLPAVIAGTLWIPATYALVRTLATPRAAWLAALAVAVAPYAISFSDYSRAFTLATLLQVLAALAAAKLVTRSPHTGRWAVAFVAAATGALYSEYYAIAFLIALVAALLVLDRDRWRLWCALGAAPLLLFAPWLGELQRSVDNLGVTKLASVAGAPTLTEARDALVALVFGEHGGALPTVQALAIVAVTAWALTRLRGAAAWLLGAGLVAVPLAHVVAATLAASDVFRQRYLTLLIPFAAATVAIALARSRFVPLLAAVLVLGGIALSVHRAGRQYEPDHERAVALAGATTTIHTNSAVIAFYGRDGDVVLDRPFGLGDGAAAARTIVDDSRNGDVRPGVRPQATVGPIVVGSRGQ